MGGGGVKSYQILRDVINGQPLTEKRRKLLSRLCLIYLQPSNTDMSNWRPAGRMGPHGLSNAARSYLIRPKNH
jgi:hypothetical protein